MRAVPRRLAAAAAACAAGTLLAAAILPPAAASGPTASLSRATLDRATSPSGVRAAAAELVNVTTGHLMWSRNLNAERPMASLTKVMTALVVIDAGDLNRKIRVTEAAEQYARAYDPSEAGLHPGDLLTARQLLEGLLLPSGSDAAYLLATTYGPGWRAFVRKMNATARELGMTRTYFANFDGLPWPTEYATYSTARDLVILGEAAMKLRVFREIVAQQSHWIGATSQHRHYYWKSTNLLLRDYPGAIGIKTGFTLGAGYCLLFAAQRGNVELIGVVLDSTKTDPGVRFTAARNLLNWGFALALPQLR